MGLTAALLPELTAVARYCYCCCVLLQQGKGKTTMPLPSAPTKDDYRDKMPASLRKMLALKVHRLLAAATLPHDRQADMHRLLTG